MKTGHIAGDAEEGSKTRCKLKIDCDKATCPRDCVNACKIKVPTVRERPTTAESPVGRATGIFREEREGRGAVVVRRHPHIHTHTLTRARVEERGNFVRTQFIRRVYLRAH